VISQESGNFNGSCRGGRRRPQSLALQNDYWKFSASFGKEKHDPARRPSRRQRRIVSQEKRWAYVQPSEVSPCFKLADGCNACGAPPNFGSVNTS